MDKLVKGLVKAIFNIVKAPPLKSRYLYVIYIACTPHLSLNMESRISYLVDI